MSAFASAPLLVVSTVKLSAFSESATILARKTSSSTIRTFGMPRTYHKSPRNVTVSSTLPPRMPPLPALCLAFLGAPPARRLLIPCLQELRMPNFDYLENHFDGTKAAPDRTLSRAAAEAYRQESSVFASRPNASE